MAGKGGRPKGGAAIKDNGDKSLPKNHQVDDEMAESANGDILGAINDALTSNMHNLGKWLDEIGQSDPVKAMSLYLQLAEYKLPKQQRTDSKQETTSPIVVNFMKASEATINVEKLKHEAPKQPNDTKKFITKTFSLDEILPKTRK